MKKMKLLGLSVILATCIIGCNNNQAETTTDIKETTTQNVEATIKENTQDTTIDNNAGTSNDQTSKQILDQYDYYKSLSEYDESYNKKQGYSELEFDLIENTVVDCGDYYTVEAEFLQGITVPGDIQVGDKITVTLNQLTGETDVWTYEEAGLVSENYPDEDYGYFAPDEEGFPVYVYRYSDDRVNCVVYKGTICIKKDAVSEVVVADMTETVSEELLNQGGYYHQIYFNEDGFAEKLVYTSD